MEELKHGERTPDLAIDTALDAAGDPVITLSGELDIASAGSLEETVVALSAHDPRQLTFDLSALHFMDSAGIAVLVNAKRKFEAVKLREPTPIVARVLELTGLSDVFQVES